VKWSALHELTPVTTCVTCGSATGRTASFNVPLVNHPLSSDSRR
jgi:hypothetical protein